MKKIIIVVLLFNSMIYGKMFNIGKFSSKLANKNIVKLAEEVSASRHLKKIALKASPKEVLANVALSISNKSSFADKLMATTSHPTDVIRQYAKYGDKYLTTIKVFNQKSLSLSPLGAKSIKKKFPTMPKIDFKNENIFNDRMVETLRYTGNKGWKVSQRLLQLAKNKPKSTLVAGMFAWYVTEPQSFFEQKEKLIGFVGSTLEEGVSDVTKLTLEASSGVANGFISIVKEKMTSSNIIVLILLFFTFMLWKLRGYIKQYFKFKIENSLEETKNKNRQGLL